MVIAIDNTIIVLVGVSQCLQNATSADVVSVYKLVLLWIGVW